MNTKTLTVSRTTAILGAAAVILAIAGTSVVSTNYAVSAVNDRARAIEQRQDHGINERVAPQSMAMYGDDDRLLVEFRGTPYTYEQVSITYSLADGSPLSEGEFTTTSDEDGLRLVADGVAPGRYQIVLHADDLYPSQLSGEIVYLVKVVE